MNWKSRGVGNSEGHDIVWTVGLLLLLNRMNILYSMSDDRKDAINENILDCLACMGRQLQVDAGHCLHGGVGRPEREWS